MVHSEAVMNIQSLKSRLKTLLLSLYCAVWTSVMFLYNPWTYDFSSRSERFALNKHYADDGLVSRDWCNSAEVVYWNDLGFTYESKETETMEMTMRLSECEKFSSWVLGVLRSSLGRAGGVKRNIPKEELVFQQRCLSWPYVILHEDGVQCDLVSEGKWTLMLLLKDLICWYWVFRMLVL